MTWVAGRTTVLERTNGATFGFDEPGFMKAQANILIVDDERSICKALSMGLSGLYSRVDMVHDGAGALQLCQNIPYDVLIVDIRLPDIDGIDLIRRIKIHSKNIIPIVITGHASTENLINAIRLGVRDYLEKPLDLGQIRSRIAWELEGRLSRGDGSPEGEPHDPHLDSLSEFVHQINNPLAIIMGSAEMALLDMEKKHFQNISERIVNILDATQKIAEINRHLLDKGVFTLPDKKKVFIDDVLAGCVEMLRQKFENEGVRLIRNHHAAEVRVEGDAFALEQAFNNLIMNAMQATDGKKDREVRIFSDIHFSGERVEISISDNGDGVPEDCRRRLFDRGFTTKRNGTGLGLHIVRKIIAQHGGLIRIDNNSGAGATATVVLPASRAL